MIPNELKNLVTNTEDENKKQEAYKLKNGKCLQVKRKTLGDMNTYTHEYVQAHGDVGYQIFFEKELGGKLYRKSIGFGPESESRTQDWVEVEND